jgi:hypothetical protein
MMPVPSHLVNSVAPKDTVIDEESLEAAVQCTCGSMRFVFLFPGQTQEYDGVTIPCTAEIDNFFFFFLVKARCTHCSKEHLLLDQDFHGWNGFVCHDKKQAALPRPPLVPWKCLSCGATEHEAEIMIQTEGKRDFISESAGAVDENQWPDGFGCFNMSIKCTECSKDTPQWICCETM